MVFTIKYLQNGIVPKTVSWHFDKIVIKCNLARIKNVTEAIKSQVLDVDDSADAINIVLIGQTGAGKSYFANALLGSMNPGHKDNKFSTKESTKRYQLIDLISSERESEPSLTNA